MNSGMRRTALMLIAALIISIFGGMAGSAFIYGGAAAEDDAAPGYGIVYSSENPIPEIAANVRPAVVQVITSGTNWLTGTRNETDMGSGSGSYIREAEDGNGGYILTNYHVVEGGRSYRIVWLDGTVTEAELVGADDGTDIAILRFFEDAPQGVTPVVMGDSDNLQIGELAIVIGNPGAGDSVLFGTVTAGIISGLERDEISAGNFSRSVSVIQTDAAINSGNSGGALLNHRGELVGIPTLKLAITYEGLGFCVPINTVKSFIDQIIATGKVSRPMLGIGVQDYDGPEEATRKYPPRGVMVVQVAEGSSAAEQGMRVYDVITEIDGVRIFGYNELTAEIDKHKLGDVVEIKVYRYYDQRGDKLDRYEEHTFLIELRTYE